MLPGRCSVTSPQKRHGGPPLRRQGSEEPNALRARAGAIVLAMRAAHAVVTAGGGRSQMEMATPQRLLREAQFYTNAVQTQDVQAAVLNQLFSPYFGM